MGEVHSPPLPGFLLIPGVRAPSLTRSFLFDLFAWNRKGLLRRPLSYAEVRTVEKLLRANAEVKVLKRLRVLQMLLRAAKIAVYLIKTQRQRKYNIKF